MTEELNEAPAVEEVAPVVEETEVNESAEVEPEQAAEQPAELTESMRKVVNKKHFQFKEEERRADDLQRQLDEFKTQQQPAEIVVPEMPDQFEFDDDEYAAKVAERDELIKQKANQDQQFNYNQQQQYQQEQKQQYEQNVRMAELSRNVTAKATKSGMTEQSLNDAINVIGQYNLGNTFAEEIMADDLSTEIIQHLSNDPIELDKISRMNDYQKGSYMTQIRAKASALKPKQSNAPAPAGDIQGSGQDPEVGKYPNIKRARIW
jgi:hypothetical protein